MRRFWHARKKDPRRLTWTVAGLDHHGQARQMPAFMNEEESRELARNITKLVDFKAGRVLWLEPDVLTGVARMSDDHRKRLAEWGIIDDARKPIENHVTDYEAELKSRANDAKSVALTMHRVRMVIDGCKVSDWAHLTGNAVSRFIGDLRRNGIPLASQTKNHFTTAIKGFAAWAVRERRIPQNPISHLKKIPHEKVQADRKITRRRDGG